MILSKFENNKTVIKLIQINADCYRLFMNDRFVKQYRDLLRAEIGFDDLVSKNKY